MTKIVIVRDGVCLKTDEQIIRDSLFCRTRQLERVIERQKPNLSPNELNVLQDEYERTFALTDKYGRR